MSIDPKFGRYCDECGRTSEKISRIYKDKDYCSTCYARVFLHIQCVKCQTSTRAHRFDTNPICKTCDANSRTCLRCSKPVPRAGIRVGEQVACPSCAIYFREKKPCAVCGTLSGRLSRLKLFGFLDPTCDPCRNKISQSTCTRCRKARTVAFQSLDYKPYCKDCIPGDEVFHVCPSCNADVVGGGTTTCQNCYVRESVQMSALLTGAGFESVWVRSLFIRYSEWLLHEHPEKPALNRLLEKHGEFFARIDTTFERASDLTRKTMLDVFGSSYMRRFLLASRFVSESITGEVSSQELKDASEHSIVRNKLASLSKKSYGTLLSEYATWLEQNQTAIRTVRLYLRAAEKFCSFNVLDSNIAPSQDKTNSFVRLNAGSRNSLVRFLTFGRNKYGWTISAPKTQRPDRLPSTVNKLKTLMDRINTEGVDIVDPSLLIKLLATSLGYKIQDVTINSAQKHSLNEYKLVVAGDEVVVPNQLEPYVAALIRRRIERESV